MKSVVITGSTRGIGLGMAEEFLKRGCLITLSGRNQEKLEKELKRLGEKFGQDRVIGLPCDVTDINRISKLWNVAREKFGKVDIWINNAGRDTTIKLFWELDPAEIAPR